MIGGDIIWTIPGVVWAGIYQINGDSPGEVPWAFSEFQSSGGAKDDASPGRRQVSTTEGTKTIE